MKTLLEYEQNTTQNFYAPLKMVFYLLLQILFLVVMITYSGFPLPNLRKIN